MPVKDFIKNTELKNELFAASPGHFLPLALEVFRFQYENSPVYRQYCDILRIDATAIDRLESIPFLPIGFFKTHEIITRGTDPETIFESSGTTTSVNSRHLVGDIALYRKSFRTAFGKFYGRPEDKCILGLLPSYLERSNSSLVCMVDELIRESRHPLSGFYLYDLDKLHCTIMHNELLKQPTLLIGVTYALLDFAEQYPMRLQYTTVMETGGMKGRREEMTRQQVHAILQQQFQVGLIHSEYGMTELLSQAYSKGDGIFHCPGWMKVLVRDEDDPFRVSAASAAINHPITGPINIIDLANLYSCSFIATDDIGRLHNNDRFEVLGRLDNSDIRGCSQLTA